MAKKEWPIEKEWLIKILGELAKLQGGSEVDQTWLNNVLIPLLCRNDMTIPEIKEGTEPPVEIRIFVEMLSQAVPSLTEALQNKNTQTEKSKPGSSHR